MSVIRVNIDNRKWQFRAALAQLLTSIQHSLWAEEFVKPAASLCTRSHTFKYISELYSSVYRYSSFFHLGNLSSGINVLTQYVYKFESTGGLVVVIAIYIVNIVIHDI